jgi:hypothetical protein
MAFSPPTAKNADKFEILAPFDVTAESAVVEMGDIMAHKTRRRAL